MNKREAKRAACRLSADAIQALLDSGWPFEMIDNGRGSVSGLDIEDEDGSPNPDGVRLHTAIEEIVTELDVRGGR